MVSTRGEDGGGSGRLDGWKDISAYLNRSVRTVQRWESQHGLPIRRKGQPGGEVVYAFRDEIDAWLRTDGARSADAVASGDDAGSGAAPVAQPGVIGAPARRVSARFVTIAVLLCLALFVPVWTVHSGFRQGSDRGGAGQSGALQADGQPARWEPTAAGVRLLDLDGQPVCDVRFDEPFVLDVYRTYPEERRLAADRSGYRKHQRELPLVQIVDVDGDGWREAAVIVKTLDETKTSLRLYDRACRLRWEYAPYLGVRFGGESYAPPFHFLWVVATPTAGGGHDLWLSLRHRQHFPSALQRISPDRRVLGTYWHPGQITVVEAGPLGGREVVLVGGVNNERRKAFLALLEKEHFGGVGPAEAERYRCTSCAPGVPHLAYVLFPDAELAGLSLGMTSVAETEMHSDWLTVNVSQNGWGHGPSSVTAMTAYDLGPDLRPFRWSYTDAYAWVHDRLFEAGQVSTRFDASKAKPLVPLEMWDGRRFREQ
jgi:hypothetical protein